MISFLTLALVPTLAVSLARLTVGPVVLPTMMRRSFLWLYMVGLCISSSVMIHRRLSRQSAGSKLCEFLGFGCIRRASEHFGEELGAEVYDVSFHRKYHRPRLKAAGIDLGGVDVNDGHILGVLLRASTDDN